MSAELIGIIAAEAALVGVQVTVSLWIVSWLRSLDGCVGHVEQRMARLVGLIEGAGLFRGETSEVTGRSSSGRTGLVLAALIRPTQASGIAAYVDRRTGSALGRAGRGDSGSAALDSPQPDLAGPATQQLAAAA